MGRKFVAIHYKDQKPCIIKRQSQQPLLISCHSDTYYERESKGITFLLTKTNRLSLLLTLLSSSCMFSSHLPSHFASFVLPVSLSCKSLMFLLILHLSSPFFPESGLRFQMRRKETKKDISWQNNVEESFLLKIPEAGDVRKDSNRSRMSERN